LETVPKRKRTTPVSNTEKDYYFGRNPEKAEDINNGKFFEEEVDIPAHYKLEKKIINDFLEEENLESTYKFVESKRGLAFANKLREESKNDGISYFLKTCKGLDFTPSSKQS